MASDQVFAEEQSPAAQCRKIGHRERSIHRLLRKFVALLIPAADSVAAVRRRSEAGHETLRALPFPDKIEIGSATLSDSKSKGLFLDGAPVQGDRIFLRTRELDDGIFDPAPGRGATNYSDVPGIVQDR